MGAFLRNLSKLDARYAEKENMRRLRKRVAEGLMDAIAQTACGSGETLGSHILRCSPGGLPPHWETLMLFLISSPASIRWDAWAGPFREEEGVS